MNRLATTTCAAVALCAAFAPSPSFASTITIDNVAQRWPWNNKIDITYTVTGGQTLSSDGTGDVYAKIVFNATIDGTAYTIDGVHDIGANASNGTHTVTWTPPSSLKTKATGCTMTATLSAADAPSGDDYMIVDLDTGAISYEGLLYSQELSNARYNTDTYKQDKLVLRKVPMGAYQVGHADIGTSGSANTPKTWNLAQYNDGATYYIGIFHVTQAQYLKITGTNPASKTTHNSNYALIADDTIVNRPVDYVTWNNMRGTDGTSHNLGTLEPSSTGTFLQRLNYLTGMEADGYGFDLPTEIMWEIAARAGTTTTYWWGNDMIDTVQSDGRYYLACRSNANDSTVAAGTTIPNPWGIYDVAGNICNMCIDTWGLADLADAESPYVGYIDASNSYRRNRGASSYYSQYSQLSRRYGFINNTGYQTAVLQNGNIGYRIVKLAK